MHKQKTFDIKKAIANSQNYGNRSTKTFLSKHEEKILDLTSIPENISAAINPNNLELKY